jgi:hypothetical protein
MAISTYCLHDLRYLISVSRRHTDRASIFSFAHGISFQIGVFASLRKQGCWRVAAFLTEEQSDYRVLRPLLRSVPNYIRFDRADQLKQFTPLTSWHVEIFQGSLDPFHVDDRRICRVLEGRSLALRNSYTFSHGLSRSETSADALILAKSGRSVKPGRLNFTQASKLQLTVYGCSMTD